MRRSRRSLVFLLASMALSLAVVRATSAPAHQVPGPAVNKSVVPPPPVSAHAVKHGVRAAPDFRPTDVPRAVSSTAIIVILPRAAPHELVPARTGWSGCIAYANGCDHLGRPLSYAIVRRPRLIDRLIVNELHRLVRTATHVSADTAAALCQGGQPTTLPQSVANDRPRTTREASARQTKSLDLQL
jgi:hypothetical protein